MTSNTRLKSKNPLLPEGVSETLKYRAIQTFGVSLLIIAIGFVLSLVTYSAKDPSFNNATGGTAENFLGMTGAYIAEFFLQTLGLSTAWLAVILITWSWRLVSAGRIKRFWLRLTLLPLALILSAISLAQISQPEAWDLMAGLGGLIGDIGYNHILMISSIYFPAINPLLYSFLIGFPAVFAALICMDISAREWRRILKRGALVLIWIVKGINGLAHAGEQLDLWRQKRRLGSKSSPGVGSDKVSQPDEISQAPRDNSIASAGSELRNLGRVKPQKSKLKTGRRADAERQPALDLVPSNEYQLPSLSLLSTPSRNKGSKNFSEGALEQNARLLESVLQEFGVKGEISEVRPGPVVTLYELLPAPGTKTSRVIGLADDIARSMSSTSARISVVTGKNAIGIELPNNHREVVQLRELLASTDYENTAASLTLALGKDISGKPSMVDLARMPHLLVAGTTGSGKSVGINSMILSLLYRLPPNQCKLILIDPKMLELSVYDGIPHLLAPVVTEPGKAVVALKWAVREMENRYRSMSQVGVRNIHGYNQRLSEITAAGEEIKRTVQTGFDRETGEPVFEEQILNLQPFPYIVIVVDEMADLMLVAGKDIEGAIRRLAQMARAAGIHLIMATQRPSVDVITGTIKANFPSRISFQVTSKIDSRTILDEQGAEQLLGSGDMLYQASGGRVQRIHGPFVSDNEVEKVVMALKKQGSPDYLEAVTEESEPSVEGERKASADDLYDEAVALVMRENRASTSFIQRHLQIGYNRAARIIEQMESQGIVSSASKVGKREVLLPDGGGFDRPLV